jgi:hypothetical protein
VFKAGKHTYPKTTMTKQSIFLETLVWQTDQSHTTKSPSVLSGKELVRLFLGKQTANLTPIDVAIRTTREIPWHVDTLNHSGYKTNQGSKRKQLPYHNTVAKQRTTPRYKAAQLDIVHGYEQDDSTSSFTGRSSPYINNFAAANLATNDENHMFISTKSARKRQKTGDGGKFSRVLIIKIHKVANTMIGENQPQLDGNAGSDVSTDVLNRLLPEQQNISERPNTLLDEQVKDTSSAGATLMITSGVDADNHNSPGPQPSGQDGPEPSRSLSLLSPTCPETISSSATRCMGGDGELSPLAGCTRQSSQPRTSFRTLLSSITLTCFQLRGSRSTNLRRHNPRPM